MTDTTNGEKSAPTLVPWRANVLCRYLLMAERFADGLAQNHALQGVRIEPHAGAGVVLIGASSHALAVIHDRDGAVSAPATVRRQEAVRAGRDERLFLGGAVHAVLGTPGVDCAVEVLHDEAHPYPNWRGALPVGPFRGAVTAVIDSARFPSFGFDPAPSPVFGGTLQLWFCEDEGVILMRSHRYPECVGVVNTVLDAERLPAIPDWLQAID